MRQDAELQEFYTILLCFISDERDSWMFNYISFINVFPLIRLPNLQSFLL